MSEPAHEPRPAPAPGSSGGGAPAQAPTAAPAQVNQAIAAKWPAFKAGVVPPLEESAAQEIWDGVLAGITEEKATKKGAGSFAALRGKLKSLLGVGKGKFALWSGGRKVSDYAVGKGYTTLEATAGGKIFDQLALQLEDEDAKPLWSVLSADFASQAPASVDVFMRAFNPDGAILFKDEAPAIYKQVEEHKIDRAAVRWHALFGPDASISEVDANARLVADHAFATPDEAVVALMKLYEKSRDYHEGITKDVPTPLIPKDDDTLGYKRWLPMLDPPKRN